MKSLINVYSKDANNLIHKYIENGCRKQKIVKYQPILGYMVDKETEWHDIFGNNIQTTRFDSMMDARNWKKENKHMDIYGDIHFTTAFIAEEYPDDIELQKKQMNIYSYDIEAFSLDTTNAPEPIRTITFHNMIKDVFYVFGYGSDYSPTESNVNYYDCGNEESLLHQVVDFFNRQDIDILTGWNIEGYDNAYLFNRLKRILGEDKAKSISPIGKVSKSTKMINKNYVDVYRIEGIICWDYMLLYQKFTLGNRESYSLDYISGYEIKAAKTEYKDEYKTLENLYNKNYQLFVSYNIHDCRLISNLDKKLNYISNAISYSYMAKCEPQNIFGTTAPWDSLVYGESIKDKLLCPPNKTEDSSDFEGGYVREPNRGLRSWGSVVDIVSSYPNNIKAANMSPETILSEREVRDIPELLTIREKHLGVTTLLDIDSVDISHILLKYNLTYTANGQFFKKDKQGIIPRLVSKLFAERVATKKLMKTTTDKELYSQLDNKQYTLKIFLNSIFGAMASNYFRYFDIRIGEAITWQGQVCARGAVAYLMKQHPDIVWDYGDTDSVEKDSLVYIDGKQDTIENFYNNLNGIRTDNKGKEYLLLPTNTTSPCFVDGDVEHKLVSHIYRHKVSKERWEITTTSGKKVVVTGDHSIMVLRNNILVEVKPKDILLSDKVIEIQK